MIDWKKVFDDTAAFPDTTEITIGDQKVTVGDLRAHNTQSQGETLKQLQERETNLAQREQRQQMAVANLANIMENVAKATGLTFDQIVAGDTAAAQAAAAKIREQAGASGIGVNKDGEIDWAKDPIYAPIAARYDRFGQEIEQDRNAMRAGFKVIQDDRLELQYLRFRLDHPDLAKNIKFEDAVKRAVDSGYKDPYGFPDVSKALNDLAQPTLLAADKQTEYERGKKEGQEAARRELMGTVAQPGGGGAAGLEFLPNPETKPGKVVSIAEQLNKAISDPQILSTLSSNGPVQ